MAILPLPELIFRDIMMMVGLESLESLHRCRQVCKTWNEVILRYIWENQSKKQMMNERIERNWGPDMLPSDEDISHARWLGDFFLPTFNCKYYPSLILETRGILDTDKFKRLIGRVKDLFSGGLYARKWTMVNDGFMCAASLAHHGLLDSVDSMKMQEVDLSPVPSQHLVSLTSCVTDTLCVLRISVAVTWTSY